MLKYNFLVLLYCFVSMGGKGSDWKFLEWEGSCGFWNIDWWFWKERLMDYDFLGGIIIYWVYE